MSFLTPACLRVLAAMNTAELEDRLDEAEIVGDRGTYYVGLDRISSRTVNRLLECTAIRDAPYNGGTNVYLLNDAGRSILRRHELAEELRNAYLQGKPFTIVDDKIQLMDQPD